jgi:hypothetical protein
MEHVLIRRLEHLTGTRAKPALAFGLETRDRPGPLYKDGAFADDDVWVQLHGGLFVARAKVRICWVGEYAEIGSVLSRTRGSAIQRMDELWAHRPRYGYAAVATLQQEVWIEPFWAGPRTYGYEWILLDQPSKRTAWLDPKPPPRGGEGLREAFEAWLAAR